MKTRRRSDAWIAMEAMLDAQRFARIKGLAGFGEGGQDADCGGCSPVESELAEVLAEVLAECERMADERAERHRESARASSARLRRRRGDEVDINALTSTNVDINKEKGREREGRKENIPPTPPIREKREEKGKGRETMPFGQTHTHNNNMIHTCSTSNAQARVREAEGDPLLRGPAMATTVPSGRMAPALADVERWAADAATKPGGKVVDAEFAREWYAVMEMANPPWTDMRGRDVSHDWRRSLWWAWREEMRRGRRGAGASGGGAQNQPEGVVLRQEGYDMAWMGGDGA